MKVPDLAVTPPTRTGQSIPASAIAQVPAGTRGQTESAGRRGTEEPSDATTAGGSFRDLPVWLVNLPRSTERRATMERRLAAIGLPFTLFPAVDGRAEAARLARDLDAAAFRRNTGREVLPGDLGCYHSHLEVWRAFLATGAETALVLEDDVVFHDDFAEAVTAALAARAGWDMLNLARIRALHPVARGRAGRWTLTAYRGPLTGTGAYLVTRACAERLLPGMLPVTRPLDHELDRTHVHRTRRYGLVPYPSHTDDAGESTITGTGFAEVSKFPKWRRIPAYALRLRNLVGKTLHLMTGAG